VTAPATVRSLHNTIACSHFNRSGASPFFTFDKTWDYLSASQSRLGSHVPSQPVDLASFGFVVMNIDLLSQECVGHSIAFSNAWTSSPASKPLKIAHGRGMCLCTSVIFLHRVHTNSERCQWIHLRSCFFGGGPFFSGKLFEPRIETTQYSPECVQTLYVKYRNHTLSTCMDTLWKLDRALLFSKCHNSFN
jgi:hypothetical protein